MKPIIAAFIFTWSAAQGEVRVWAVGDAVRVNPVTGKLFEEPQPPSSVWDAPRKCILLRAARNEFVAFQVIVETSQRIEDVNLEFQELRHASGARFADLRIGIFKAWYVSVRRASTGYEGTSRGSGWYPDALMPKRRAGLQTGFPFSIPDLHNNIPDQTNHAIWIDVFVPNERENAPPGIYKGQVHVTWKGGGETLDVALEVWDFALPQESHLPGDIWNGSMKSMPPERELQYYQLARQHRFHPLIYAYRPRLSISGTTVKLDWREYDDRLSRYLDGSAFTAKHGYWGPGYGLPVSHMMLPFDIEKGNSGGSPWPVRVPPEGRTPEYESIWKETGRQIREHFDRNPAWARVRKIAFLNGLDESYNESAYEKMLYYGKLLHDALGRGWFKHRIDGGYSREAMEKLYKEVDLWVCHTVAFDIDTVEHYRTKGVETWFYGPMIYEQRKNSGCGSNTFLDLDLLVNRAIGWIGWKYQAGWVEWEFDWNAYASWYEAENFKEPNRIYNGSGQLIYRGEVMGYNQPVPSIRLKAQRRGLQDYEYFWLLAQKDGGRQTADELVNAPSIRGRSAVKRCSTHRSGRTVRTNGIARASKRRADCRHRQAMNPEHAESALSQCCSLR